MSHTDKKMKAEYKPTFESMEIELVGKELQLWVDGEKVVWEFESPETWHSVLENEIVELLINEVVLDYLGYPFGIEILLLTKGHVLAADGVEEFLHDVRIQATYVRPFDEVEKQIADELQEMIESQGIEVGQEPEGWSKWKFEDPVPQSTVYEDEDGKIEGTIEFLADIDDDISIDEDDEDDE